MSTNMVNQIREAEQQAEEFLSDARIRSKKIVTPRRPHRLRGRESSLRRRRTQSGSQTGLQIRRRMKSLKFGPSFRWKPPGFRKMRIRTVRKPSKLWWKGS